MPDDSPIDDDTFAYDGGQVFQCISGFGRNAVNAIDDAIAEHMPDRPTRDELMERVDWHINELVRWCRAFNGENQRLKKQVAALEDHPAIKLAMPPLPTAP